jgi:hypothetical protein
VFKELVPYIKHDFLAYISKYICLQITKARPEQDSQKIEYTHHQYVPEVEITLYNIIIYDILDNVGLKQYRSIYQQRQNDTYKNQQQIRLEICH